MVKTADNSAVFAVYGIVLRGASAVSFNKRGKVILFKTTKNSCNSALLMKNTSFLLIYMVSYNYRIRFFKSRYQEVIV